MLPAQPGPLIGRAAAVEDGRARLIDPWVRLLTLTGPGGSGKTRLALAIAEVSSPAFADGAYFVDLALIRDPALVASEIARALGVGEEEHVTPLDTVRYRLLDHAVLVVLDNFEHVLSAALDLATLLQTCRGLKLLVTSREPLRLRWEYEVPVPPLALPDSTAIPDPDQLARAPAVELFVQRAFAVQPGFRLSAANASAVAEICVRLDGLPLAIELAAARIRHLEPIALLRRLDQRLAVLTDGARDLPPRQQTLRSAIGWSYDMLSSREQALFRQSAVFAGGFNVETAEAVMSTPGDDLSALVAKSLLRCDDGGRFRMLETIRDYALERLADTGEQAEVATRHADFFLTLAEAAEPELTGPRQSEWLHRLECERDNLRTALDWLLARGEAERALRLAAALWRFWETHGHVSEGARLLDACLALGEAQPVPAAMRAKALTRAGSLKRVLGDHEPATRLVEAALELRTQLGDRRGAAASLANLGLIAQAQADYPLARAHYEASLAAFRDLGDRRGIDAMLTNLGMVRTQQGDYTAASALLEESVALSRDQGHQQALAIALQNLGLVAIVQGDETRAAASLQQSYALFLELGDRANIGWTRLHQAKLVRRQGDVVRSDAWCRESLTLSRELAHRGMAVACLEGLAAGACTRRDLKRAAVLVGAAESARELLGLKLQPTDRDEHERSLAVIRVGLGGRGSAAALAAGRGMSLDQAIACALDAPQPKSSADPTPETLSKREREVAELVAQGLTNRQIAERLVISERTADGHVRNIFEKLGIKGRAQIGAWVAGRQARTR